MAWYLPSAAALCCGVGVFVLLPEHKRQMYQSIYGLPGFVGDFSHLLATSRLGKRLNESQSLLLICEEFQRRLIRSGISVGAQDTLGLMMAAFIAVSMCAGLLGASLVASIVAASLMLLGIPVLTSSIQRKRTRELAQEMPQILRTLASALGSGESLSQAIAYVGVHEQGRAAQEFGRAALKLRCGEASQDVLKDLSSRLKAPGVQLLTSALTISQRTGSALDGLLQRSAVMVERQEELERLLSVKTAQARLSVRIVCVMPVLMVGVLSLFSADFQRGLTTMQGLVCVGAALVMDAVALGIIRTMMKGIL